MKTELTARCRLIAVAAMALLMLAACGEDVVDGANNDAGSNGSEDANGANDAANQENDDSGPTGPDDCADDEFYNPQTGECRPDTSDNDNQDTGNQDAGNQDTDNQDTGEECDDGLVWDELAEECVDPDDVTECGPGALVGTSCRTDGGSLPNATITLEGVDCDGEYFTMDTVSDAEGNYQFDDIPSGRHEINVASGSFDNTDEVEIYPEETTELTSDNAKVCVENENVSIGIVAGSFDDIPGILDPLNITYDIIDNAGETFGSVENLKEYDIIFVECINNLSSLTSNPFDADVDDLASNIRTFVESGHSLYVSDYSHSFVSEAFPEIATYLEPNPNVGTSGQTTTADVVSDDMQSLLGSSTTEIYFDTSWSVVDSVGPMTTTHFSGDVQTSAGDLDDKPLMFSYDDLVGNGRVIYTSFHNQDDLQENMQEILEYVIFQL